MKPPPPPHQHWGVHLRTSLVGLTTEEWTDRAEELSRDWLKKRDLASHCEELPLGFLRREMRILLLLD